MSDRLTRAQAYGLFLIAAAGLIAFSALSAAIPNGGAWLTCAYYLICTALPVWAMTKRRGCIEALRPYPMVRGSMIPVLFLPGLILIAVNSLTLLWQIPFELIGARIAGNEALRADSVRELVRNILLSAALPAVCEEFLFRGAILSALEPYGTKRAIIITSALFTMLHGSIIGAPAEFILGIVLGMIAVCTGSVYGSIIYHTLHNAITMVILYMQRGRLSDEPASVLEAIGGAQGIVSVVVNMALFALPAFFFLRALVRRAKMLKTPVYPENRERLTGGARALLIAGCAMACILYAFDILSMIPGVMQ